MVESRRAVLTDKRSSYGSYGSHGILHDHAAGRCVTLYSNNVSSAYPYNHPSFVLGAKVFGFFYLGLGLRLGSAVSCHPRRESDY